MVRGCNESTNHSELYGAHAFLGHTDCMIQLYVTYMLYTHVIYNTILAINGYSVKNSVSKGFTIKLF